MKRLILLGALAGSLGFASQSMAAVKVGTLTCSESHGWGLVLGSSRHVQCVFSNGRDTERYEGSINKIGVDLGYKSGAKVIWAVLAPESGPREGALAGHYGGVTASATAGYGVGAHVLVGGFDRSITLQPVSVEGNRGLDVAAGIGELTLRHDDT
ncbi:DUF992 domain-containing protein [Phenylobacterium sp.]|jgi:hypothetical protein|uniref:DUF992 domain-containing protein n=1 Tax=Phenylobacterium sp. TaxID=1871053 RepID=UPI002F4105AC